MTKSEKIEAAIESVIESLMNRVMNRVLHEVPFIPEEHHLKKPLYAALVPDEIFKGSHFERRFVTPFGKAWEKLAIAAARENLGIVFQDHPINGTIKSERLRRITEILNQLENSQNERKPHWEDELSYVLDGNGQDVSTRVICDIYAEDIETGNKYAFEIKAPLPNSDQTKVSKEKLLKLYSMNPRKVNEAYFALPYNPFGNKDNYKWSFAERWFNMKEDKVVLIGNETWDKIGGSGTYELFVKTVNKVGQKYKNRIYREFLEIEPPANQAQLK